MRYSDADNLFALRTNKRKLTEYGSVIIAYSIVALVTISALITIPGVMGLRHDWSIPPFDYQLSSRISEPFHLWTSKGYPIDRPSLLYYRLFEDLLISVSNAIGIDLSKLVIFSLIALAGITSYSGLRLLKFNLPSSFLAGLFYLSTPVVFNQAIAGHLPYLFSYALMPLVIALFILGMREKSFRKALLAGVLFALAIAQLQFVILVSLLLIIVTIWFIIRNREVKPIKYLLISVICAFLMHSFWIVPLFIGSNTSLELIAPSGYHEIVNSSTVLEALEMIGYPHQYDYSSILSEQNQALLIIPVLIASFSLVLLGKNTRTGLKLLGFVSLILGIFLVTATKSPLGEFWSVLYDNIPGMALFREAYHASALVAFGIFILLALVLESASSLLKSKIRLISAYGAFFAVTILIASPMYSGNFRNQVETYDFSDEYNLENYDLAFGDSRTLFIPSFEPVKYDELSYAHIDPMLSYPLSYSFPQSPNSDNAFSNYRNFLLSKIDEEDFGKYLQLVNVKYIVVRKDVTSAFFGFVPRNPDGTPYLSPAGMIAELNKKLDKVYENDKLIIYYNPINGYFKIDPGYAIAIGNYNALGSLLNIENESVILASDILRNSELTKMLSDTIDTVFIQGDDLNELVFVFTENKSVLIPTGDNLLPDQGWTITPLATWWWKEQFLYEPPPYNRILFHTGAPTSKTIVETISVDDDGRYKLFVRLFENSKGGSLGFSIAGNDFDVNTRNELDRFTWKDIGTLSLNKGDQQITIENKNGFNAFNSIVLVEEGDYQSARDEFATFLQNKKIVHVFDADSDLIGYDVATNIPETNRQNSLPGQNNWRDIEVAKSGNYNISVRGIGQFNVKIGSQSFTVNSDLLGFTESEPIFLEAGKHRLEVTLTDSGNKARNLSFEGGPEILSNYWSVNNPMFDVGLDANGNGDYAVKASTAQSTRDWSGIRSAPLEVNGNTEYLVTTKMKYANTNSSHIKLEGFYPDDNQWKQLTPFIARAGTGNSDWQSYSAIIKTPAEVNQIRIVLHAGWVLDEGRGDAITWFDDLQIYELEDLPVLDTIVLSLSETGSTLDANENDASKQVQYEHLNPTLWKAKVSTSEPFMLTFAEAYNPLWEATIYKDGKLVETTRSIPLYSVINGFWINTPGELEIVIQYVPQQWFYIGASISAITFAVAMVIVFLPNAEGIIKRTINIRKVLRKI